jgi:DNA-binding transcriptional LysR family regulator
LELRHLEHFVAVAEERSFTRAARQIHLGQSALSVSVRALERELGTGLFARTTHEVALTDAGRALLPEARRTLDAAEAARNAVVGAREGLRGVLRLGLMQALTAVDAAALIGQFRRERPEVEIRPRPAAGGSVGMAVDVVSGDLDVAFVSLPAGPPPGLSLAPLAVEPIRLVCRPDHPFAPRRSLRLRELVREPFVDFPAGWGTRMTVDRAVARAGLRREIAIEVPDVTTMLELVRAGLGIGLVPESMIANRERLHVAPIRATLNFEVGLAVPARRPLSPVAAAFVKLVRAAHTGP